MSVLIVTYDLAQPNANYETLLRQIKTRAWARLSESSYLVATPEDPEQLRDRLMKVLRAGDKLFVGSAPAPSAWHGLPDGVSRWILANQT
jgi:hypothetical protein